MSSQLLGQRETVCTRRNWSKFDKLWDQLEPAHMSGDETDGEEKRHPPRWSITRAGWMSKKMRKCFRKFDGHYKADWENPKRYGKKRRTGRNPPRHRVEPKHPKVEDGPAPTGLWRNCYSRRWLASLKPWDIERLQIVDADFDFSLPEDPPKHADDEDSDDESSSFDAELLDNDDDDDGAFMDDAAA
ncbi:hypothetical protein K466DRAFT_500380 [Polyporus arcularius HHB13444]|uniref:Uncharacterized protein n=1 Tax=Polyporus arcularius HHB13444 TaxID=1314778 RepID=A0A5C3P087_9APHY|nr:hypothetical protein K466DRAFT_500380 [Polyporus arcularius HHB13444]